MNKLDRFTVKVIVAALLILAALWGSRLIAQPITSVTIKLKDSLTFTATPVTKEQLPGDYKQGSIKVRSMSYTFVQAVQDPNDEKQFTLTGLKPGKSNIVITCLDVEGKSIKVSFVVTVGLKNDKPVEGFYIK